MDLLKLKKSLLLTAQGRVVVKKYNKMALVLTEYEILHYQSWLKIVEICHRNIQVCHYSYLSFHLIITCLHTTGDSFGDKGRSDGGELASHYCEHA